MPDPPVLYLLDASSYIHRAFHAVKGLTTSQGAPTGAVQGDWLSDRPGNRFDAGTLESTGDRWDDYLVARDELTDFLVEPHTVTDFKPGKGFGRFDAEYLPATGDLNLTLRLNFLFVRGRSTTPVASGDLDWDLTSSALFITEYINQVRSVWSGNHTFCCTRPGWEQLRARTNVDVVLDDANPHFNLIVEKIPAGKSRQCSVSPPEPDGSASTVTLNSESLLSTKKKSGWQIPAMHETGHMLDLDDEYGHGGVADHSDLVEAEFGHPVIQNRDGRIMSNGMDISPEHGVTFLAALRAATEMPQWSATSCPAPTPEPMHPEAP